MSNSLLHEEMKTLEALALKLLKEKDPIHNAEEVELLSKRIYTFAISAHDAGTDGQRYELYSKIEKKIRIVVDSFAHNFHPEKHEISENIVLLDKYIYSTYGFTGVA